MNALTPIFNDIGEFLVPALFNLYFAAASIPIGFAFAVLVALGRASPNPVLRRLASAYIFAFRGSPIFIQFFMLYALMLSLNLSVWKPLGIDWLVMHPLFLGPLVLMFNTTAYTAAILYGALQAVPRGEIEAARAFGMSRARVFWSVTWPNMIRIAWPAYTNEVVFLFHSTALVYYTLPVIDQQKDIMNKAGELFERDYNAFLHFGVAALFFFVISFLIFSAFGIAYRVMMHHTLPAGTPLVRVRFDPRYIR